MDERDLPRDPADPREVAPLSAPLGAGMPVAPIEDAEPVSDEALGREAAGGAVGAVGGAIVGGLVGGPPGALVGGIVGAVGGAVVGGATEPTPDEEIGAEDAVDDELDPDRRP